MSDSLWLHGLPTMLLRPWDFPGKGTGMGCHFLLQRIFPTQGLNLGLLHCRQTLYHLSHKQVHINPSKSLVTLYISICTLCFLVSLLQEGEQKPDVPKQLLYAKRSKDEFSSQGEFSGCCPQFFLTQPPKHQLIQFCTIPPFGSLRLPSVVFFCPFTGLTSQCSFLSPSLI